MQGSHVPGLRKVGWHSGHLGFSPNHVFLVSTSPLSTFPLGISNWNEFNVLRCSYPVRPLISRGKMNSGTDKSFLSLRNSSSVAGLWEKWISFEESFIDLGVGDLWVVVVVEVVGFADRWLLVPVGAGTILLVLIVVDACRSELMEFKENGSGEVLPFTPIGGSSFGGSSPLEGIFHSKYIGGPWVVAMSCSGWALNGGRSTFSGSATEGTLIWKGDGTTLAFDFGRSTTISLNLMDFLVGFVDLVGFVLKLFNWRLTGFLLGVLGCGVVLWGVAVFPNPEGVGVLLKVTGDLVFAKSDDLENSVDLWKSELPPKLVVLPNPEGVNGLPALGVTLIGSNVVVLVVAGPDAVKGAAVEVGPVGL